MRNLANRKALARARFVVVLVCLSLITISVFAQSNDTLTPSQRAIEKQRERLTAGDVEERRDAVIRLGNFHLSDASRAAMPALSDPSPIVRAMAAKAVLSVNPEHAVAALLPLLKDKDEFVRREAAYALGQTHSRTATAALSERLLNDKEDGVRGAAAVALGDIRDEAAVISLVGTLAPELSAREGGRRKRERNVFVLRSAAAALGKIKSRAGTAALVSVMSNEKLDSDVRREAAHSLGLIGDPSATAALRTVSTSSDPYLSQLASQALKRIERNN
jgi:HEAT repeat protein